MNRRSFLAGLGVLVGGVVLEEAIPFGRVWSFPTNIVVAKPNTILTISEITREALAVLEKNLVFTKYISRDFDREFAVGGHINIRKPARYAIS